MCQFLEDREGRRSCRREVCACAAEGDEDAVILAEPSPRLAALGTYNR
jgi:hypothetical protein